jgi:hypothetical protein
LDRCVGNPAVEPSDFACRLAHCRDASGNPLACIGEITLSSTP